MSDWESGEAQSLYVDMGELYDKLTTQLKSKAKGYEAEVLAERLARGMLTFQLEEYEALPLQEEILGADHFRPDELYPGDMKVLEGYFEIEGESVAVPQILETEPYPDPEDNEPCLVAFVAAGIEGPALLGNGIDLQTLGKARGTDRALDGNFIGDYTQALYAAKRQPIFLSDAQCHALRLVLPHVELDVRATLREFGPPTPDPL